MEELLIPLPDEVVKTIIKNIIEKFSGKVDTKKVSLSSSDVKDAKKLMIF